jgi:hypothetical protein
MTTEHSMNSSTLTIEEVEADFAAWRVSKKLNSPTPIPEALCNQVRVLLQTYPRAEVLRRCGVTLQQARNKGLLTLTPAVTIPENKELTPFVKIPMIQSVPLKAIILTLRCGDAHLSLDNPSNEQVQFIITTMLR